MRATRSKSQGKPPFRSLIQPVGGRREALTMRRILRERLNLLQWGALACTVAGLANLIRQPGELVVWIPLTIGITFGCYGYLKKIGSLTPLQGLLLETIILSIPAIGWLLFTSRTNGQGLGDADVYTLMLIAGTGLLSIIPLILFTFAARRLQLVTMGFLQYIAPSTHFIIGIAIFSKIPTGSETLTFSLIWLGLALAAWGAVLRSNRERAVARETA